jgi:mannose-6-phosphate isomerase-like protein (cupin superfamily)
LTQKNNNRSPPASHPCASGIICLNIRFENPIKELTMGMNIVRACIVVGLIALVPAAAGAQPAPAQPGPAIDITKAMLDAAAKIGAAALKPGVSASDRNIALANTPGYNVTVAYVTRPASKVMAGTALSHDKITEIYYVLSGSGTQVTGTLVDAKQQGDSTTIGPGWRSAAPIKDGRTTILGPGEMQIIPPGLGHGWSQIADGGISYLVIRIDPDHLLALAK